MLNHISHKLLWQVWDVLEVPSKHPAAFIFDAPSGSVLHPLSLEAAAVLQRLGTLKLRSLCWSPGACSCLLVYGQPSKPEPPSLETRGVLAIVDVVEDRVLACSQLHGTREHQDGRFDAVTWHPKSAGFRVSYDVELEGRSCFWQAGFAVGVLPAPFRVSGGFSADGQRFIAARQEWSEGTQELLESGALFPRNLELHHVLYTTITGYHIRCRDCPQSDWAVACLEETQPSLSWLPCDSEHVLCNTNMDGPDSFVATLGSSTRVSLMESFEEAVRFSPLSSFIATTGSQGFCILELRSGLGCWSLAGSKGQTQHVKKQDETLGLAGSVMHDCAGWLPSGQGMVLLADKRKRLEAPSLHILMFA